jgi:dienelactone hydrolase
MRIGRWIAAAALLLCAVPSAAQTQRQAGPVGEPASAAQFREQVWWVPMAQPRQPNVTVHLETTVYRPEGNGPFALIVLNHGSPRDDDDRRKSPRTRYFEQSRWFVQQGYAVVLPMRRGYANSEGDWAEAYGKCENPDYASGGLSTANDIGAVLSYFRGQPFVDRHRVVIVGQSAGGWGALATASRNPEGVLGIVNFAGGRGSQGTNTICGEDKLVEAATRFGRSARVRALWLYAENDLYFGPKIARRMFDAYTGAGAPAEFVTMRSFGRDGHGTFANWDASDRWVLDVGKFLAAVNPSR